MALKDQIMADLKTAMKEKDQQRLAALRNIQSAIKNKEIEVRPAELSDDEVMGVLKKLAKQRQESIEQYENAGRSDLVEKEKNEHAILKEYLPEAMSREQVEAVVDEVINALGASSMKDMGAVMKEVQSKTAGAADNKLISEIAKSKLQS